MPITFCRRKTIFVFSLIYNKAKSLSKLYLHKSDQKFSSDNQINKNNVNYTQAD